MSASDLPEFRIIVRPSPETNDHEVCLLADDANLVDQFADGLMGLDPDDLLIEPCVLRADSSSRVALIGRCSCGIVGCGSVEVKIQKDGERVIWTAIDSSRNIQFEATQYKAEVERALHDHSWETPRRTAARLISQAVDRKSLARRGFEFTWASGRCKDGMMTVSLVLRPGPYQILVELAWNGEDIDSICSQFKSILSQPPETWPIVLCIPQERGLASPSFVGPIWK